VFFQNVWQRVHNKDVARKKESSIERSENPMQSVSAACRSMFPSKAVNLYLLRVIQLLISVIGIPLTLRPDRGRNLFVPRTFETSWVRRRKITPTIWCTIRRG